MDLSNKKEYELTDIILEQYQTLQFKVNLITCLPQKYFTDNKMILNNQKNRVFLPQLSKKMFTDIPTFRPNDILTSHFYRILSAQSKGNCYSSK